VLLASNSDEALTLFQQAVRKENPPCLAILDLTLPKGLDGVETLKELRRHNPSLPAIASSGYSHKPVRKGPEDFGFDEFLAKPYSIKDLETVLIKVLAK
jgi:CheY-like chemotaxis protein